MRQRCALAVRVIGAKEELGAMRQVFSLDASKNPKAKEFTRFLDTENLKIHLFGPDAGIGEKIDKILREREKDHH